MHHAARALPACLRVQRVPLKVAMLVDNIRIEPDGQRPRVIVHGTGCRKSASAKCGHETDSTDSISEVRSAALYCFVLHCLLSGRGVQQLHLLTLHADG